MGKHNTRGLGPNRKQAELEEVTIRNYYCDFSAFELPLAILPQSLSDIEGMRHWELGDRKLYRDVGIQRL